jgi:cytochrome c-type biogenesis protein CcmF
VVEAVNGEQLTIGAPYFRTALAPVFLVLLLLLGTAPLFGWRRTAGDRLVRRLRVPVLAAAVVVVSAALAGVRRPEVVAGFGLAALAAVANLQVLGSGLARSRRGGRAGTARALRRGRRHYAGLTVHVGLAVLAAGVTASSALAHQAEVTLQAGQTTSFQGYRLRYDGMATRAEAQRVVLTTSVSVTDPGGATDRPLTPRLNLYPAASEPIGSPSIHRGAVWDLYASVVALQDNGGSATFRFYRNPGVSWLWLGGAVMALGGLAAAWPGDRRRRTTTRPEPEDAVARRPLAEVGSA